MSWPASTTTCATSLCCPACEERRRTWAGPSELAKLRYPPTGDVRLWVQFGPDGPPPKDDDA